MIQFLGETFLLTLASLLLSGILTPWLLHVFDDFIPKDLHLDHIWQPDILLFGIVLLITVTLLSGFYPALVLSRFQPVLVLKNQLIADPSATRRTWVRKSLTVFQFTIAQCFVMAAIIVGRQIHYSINSDLGFRKEAIVTINTPWFFEKKDDRRFVFLQRLRALPGIEQACTGSLPPSDDGAMSQTVTYTDGKKNIPIDLQIKFGDSNYVNLYRLKILAGRAPIPSDTPREYVINETARRFLGFKTPADAVGATLGSFPIAGVVADFHHASLRTPIQPLALASARNFEFDLLLALRPQVPGGATWSSTLAQAGAIYKQLFPGSDYHYQFLDESIARFYTGEQKIARLLKWATGLTILISCLGLAGLVIFTTNSRIKEIGIRKVLGASVAGIAALLSKDFVKLLVVAFVIATPIAWWALHKWLDNYAYKAPVSWWIFPLAGIGMTAIALLTMSIRTLRSAMANPVHALRSE
jgi:ABC-type antimicrobial peptide transport system permease subunit